MDSYDREIVTLLEADGRLTHREIADRIGLSRSAAANRLRRLLELEEVVVRGVVHPAILGRGHLAYVVMEISGSATKVAEAAAERADAAFVAITTGHCSVAVEIHNATAAATDAAVAELRSMESVISIETLVYADVIRDTVGPVGQMSATVDDIDLALIQGLQRDGRASYVALGELSGLSAAGARLRVRNLLENRVVRVGALVRQSGHESHTLMGLGIRLTGAADEVIEALKVTPQVVYLARTLGQFDLLTTMRGFTTGELVEALDQVREIPGIHSVETWTYLRVIKETYEQLAPDSHVEVSAGE
ncbi:AsnC family transcriptional regulator [Micromonospora sp. NPDC048830]|uniref:AsnC family transcriptional regulator n=1 Tax=Micromonospora sp. NPDC048830 TaxID=3364257 RepID=UPI00371A786D